ncbi:succinyl-CoA synthetase beta subunit [Saprolegnia diclina VS20]|uniref:Succinate--CoA ligase [ADP-forming] subunit beta, mitochondrial n=1 Tax=Saprolegnia diclina (strain VS20) TaxID=1156394 RepID=T0Q0Y0_SAPDV|nr:succinyl-CoA synthetase beta subunit [Saprolegnia diclina VS20]EQC28226.1 succinyl-CoA synthetase beta subunit [Saprolegnia diclina VS20]|eukprot:XP_008618375.1 succinyl-CoA synthetase beta subunit [Saprolegnia diclina VS20]
MSLFRTVAKAAPLLRAPGQQVRRLNLHEYQSMEIMKSFGVAIPASLHATTPAEAEAAYNTLKGGDAAKDVVIKAQALTGGRGLGHFKNGFKGGVHMCTKPEDAKNFAEKMLGETLVTKQTGEKGIEVAKVFLMERVYMRREMYFSILMDRASNGPVLVASPAGGTSIEDVAHATPELIFKEAVNITTGPTSEQLNRLAANMGLSGESQKRGVELMNNLYNMFIGTDATLVEINPLAETPEGHVYACDAKINFDDNASFRHKDIFAKRDKTQEDPREVEASAYDLNYIGLDGNIGCLVNGAGLAMATMDIISLFGGSPANFLDVGGGATESQVKKAFEILNADPQVKSILVNIFGGIMRCDVIAAGVIAAAKDLGMKKPIVIRLQGTNVEKARQLIENSGFRMIVANDLDDAAQKAVKIADIVAQAEEVHVNVSFELPL